MESGLFRPDNFSQTDIKYKKFSGSPAVFNDVLALYFPAFEIKDVLQLDRLEINSQNFQILLFINGTDKKILLRKHKLLTGLDQINFYLEILSALDKSGAKVSRVINSLNGGHAVKISDGIYTLFDFIEADYFSPNENSLKAAAKEIAKAHQGLKNLNEDRVSVIESFSKIAATYYNKIKSYSENDFLEIEKILASKKRNEDDELVLKELAFIKKTILEVKSREKEIALLPKQIIHSDLHPHNILMNGGAVGAIIDFDTMRLSQRARDIAFAVYRLGRQFLIGSGDETAALKAPLLLKSFIDSYMTIEKLSKEEIRLMPILIKDEFLLKILFVLNGIYKEGNFLWAGDLRKFLAAMQEINYFWPNK